MRREHNPVPFPPFSFALRWVNVISLPPQVALPTFYFRPHLRIFVFCVPSSLRGNPKTIKIATRCVPSPLGTYPIGYSVNIAWLLCFVQPRIEAFFPFEVNKRLVCRVWDGMTVLLLTVSDPSRWIYLIIIIIYRSRGRWGQHRSSIRDETLHEISNSVSFWKYREGNRVTGGREALSSMSAC